MKVTFKGRHLVENIKIDGGVIMKTGLAMYVWMLMGYTTGTYSEVVSYPLLINMLVKKRKINIYSYTMKKFKRMDAFLTKIDKIEV